MGTIFNAKGRLTSKWIFRSGQKSNLFEYLCLSFLPTKRRSKMKTLACPQYFFQRSRSCNSKVNRLVTHPRFYGCPVYLKVWWWSNKKWRRYCLHISLFLHVSLWCSRKSNSTANSLIWLEIKFVRDFIPVLASNSKVNKSKCLEGYEYPRPVPFLMDTNNLSL